MKLGILVGPSHGYSYRDLLELARAAEDGGFESFWVSDHLYYGTGRPDQDCLEAWTLLAGLARETSKIRLGTLVTAVQFRNPALLAKIVAGVDQMSDGRIEFGIGAANKQDEFEAYGYDFLGPSERLEQLAEAMQICAGLWREPRLTFHGRHYRVTNAVSSPKPRQRPRPPVWIGGSRPRLMRLAARYADGFDLPSTGSALTVEELVAVRRRLDGMCAEAGRDSPLLMSHGDTQVSTALRAGAAETAAAVARLRGFAEAGLYRCLISVPRDAARETVERAASEIVPVLAEARAG